MCINLIALLSSSGCFSRPAQRHRVQMSTEAYHKDVRPTTETNERVRLLSAIARSTRCCGLIRARIEAYLYRYSQPSAWHLLADCRKDAVVREFYANAKFTHMRDQGGGGEEGCSQIQL